MYSECRSSDNKFSQDSTGLVSVVEVQLDRGPVSWFLLGHCWCGSVGGLPGKNKGKIRQQTQILNSVYVFE